MLRYSDSVIEEIKNKITMSEVASSYVPVVRKGRENWCCCPIHGEKTPSMILHDDSGMYHCFGCGDSGSMFKLIQQMEHISFSEAVEILAKRTGVVLQQKTESEVVEIKKKEAMSDLYERLSKLFSYLLKTSKNAENARKYISSRKISDETSSAFMLGYSPEGLEWLWNFLKKKGFSDEILEKSGLFTKNNTHISFFCNRVMFPVRNWKGECIAFSGRDLSGTSRAKYINSSETDIYKKKSTLFGFYESIKTLREKGEIIICEGNFDVISLHQAGVTNAVATCGTAFTPEHCRLIKRYCSKVVLLFDSDEAGQKATKNALLLCQQNGLENYVIRPLPGAKDASQMLQEQGPEALRSSTENVQGGFVYLVHLALKMYDTRQFKTNSSVFKEVRPYLDATESPIERQGYIKYLSEILKVSEDDILKEYEMKKTLPDKADQKPDDRRAFNLMRLSQDMNFMLHLVNHRDKFESMRQYVGVNMLTDPDAISLYTVLEDAGRGEIRTDEVFVQMIQDEKLRGLVESALGNKLFFPPDIDWTLKGSAAQIRCRNLKIKRDNLLKLLNSGAMEGSDPEEITEFLTRKSVLDREIEELQRSCEAEEV